MSSSDDSSTPLPPPTSSTLNQESPPPYFQFLPPLMFTMLPVPTGPLQQQQSPPMLTVPMFMPVVLPTFPPPPAVARNDPPAPSASTPVQVESTPEPPSFTFSIYFPTYPPPNTADGETPSVESAEGSGSSTPDPSSFGAGVGAGVGTATGAGANAGGRRRYHPYTRIAFFPSPAGVYFPLGFEFIRSAPSLQGQPPASESAIKKLRRSSGGAEEECTVCQEVAKEEGVLQMPCGHLFHEDCLLPWLNKSNTCPTCRWELSTDNVEYNLGVQRRMLQRRIDLCALADIGCGIEDEEIGWMKSEKGQVKLKGGCQCRFHSECMARWLRINGYEKLEKDDCVELKCPRCRKMGTASGSWLSV